MTDITEPEISQYRISSSEFKALRKELVSSQSAETVYAFPDGSRGGIVELFDFIITNNRGLVEVKPTN